MLVAVLNILRHSQLLPKYAQLFSLSTFQHLHKRFQINQLRPKRRQNRQERRKSKINYPILKSKMIDRQIIKTDR